MSPEIVANLNRRISRKKLQPDQVQTFWVGVMEAESRSNAEGREDFLFLSGLNRVRDENKRDWSRKLERYCEVCGTRYGYRGQRTCCGRATVTRHRQIKSEWLEIPINEVDPSITISIEQYVMQQGGTKREVAQRFLLDRYDIFYENYSRKIADEVGISPPAVSRWVKSIRADLRDWLG
jgi:hypothetical protein